MTDSSLFKGLTSMVDVKKNKKYATLPHDLHNFLQILKNNDMKVELYIKYIKPFCK